MAVPNSDAIIIPPVYYGVWRPGKGWLKMQNPNTGEVSPFADLHREVAVATAKWLGCGARVEYVDDSLYRLETTLLEADQIKKDKVTWLTSLSYKLKLKRKLSSP